MYLIVILWVFFQPFAQKQVDGSEGTENESTNEDFKKSKENVLYKKQEGTPEGLYL